MLSTEGSAGTVTADDFEDWIKDYLVPVLGDYGRGEPNSILVLDNASTHYSENVLWMVRERGTYILFAAPYSADLNPIELAFNVYKMHLKKLTTLFDYDWYSAHLHAIEQVNQDTCIKRCGVPGSDKVLTSEEEKKVFIIMNLLI